MSRAQSSSLTDLGIMRVIEDYLRPGGPSRGPYDTDPDGSGMLRILLDDIVDQYAELLARFSSRRARGQPPLAEKCIKSLRER
jgi:hypothetical protein